MSDDRWQKCRERFTAQCKAVKELAGDAPRDSRNESLKGESHSREVASGEGTISSQHMSDHAAVKEAHRKFTERLIFASTRSYAEAAQLLADFERDERVKEAEWWAVLVPNGISKELEKQRDEHIAQLKRGEL